MATAWPGPKPGAGPVVVKAANWLTHLEYEWSSPVWKHWLQFFSGAYRFVRYDERGCGMSDWTPGAPLTLDQWASDLESVVEAAQPAEPVTLLGISQGAATCIHYTLRHPERVARLILYGGYAHGALKRNVPAAEVALPRDDRPGAGGLGARQPDVPPGVHVALHSGRHPRAAGLVQRPLPEDDHRRDRRQPARSPRPDGHLGVARPGAGADARAARSRRRSRADLRRPVPGRGIPGAEFVELDSRNHVLLEPEPAWQRFQEAVLAFVPSGAATGDPAFSALSPRERQVLALMADGLSNTDIAERLQISDKTVRNHASNLFDKLGVWSRAQAIVFARDHGFSG